MRRNVIILTVGISGSSILAGLVSRAGYWPGDHTMRKPDYNTYENAELVKLNKQLLQLSGVGEQYTMVYQSAFVDAVKALYNTIDLKPYQQFVEHCNDHGPWVWKDPRLWLTMPFWQHFLDLRTVQFLVNDRAPFPSWISMTLRRQIQTYAYSKRYSQQVMGSIQSFLVSHSVAHLHLLFEALVYHPDASIALLNRYLDVHLTVDDLAAVYNKPLRQRVYGPTQVATAFLIYLKNYKLRYR